MKSNMCYTSFHGLVFFFRRSTSYAWSLFSLVRRKLLSRHQDNVILVGKDAPKCTSWVQHILSTLLGQMHLLSSSKIKYVICKNGSANGCNAPPLSQKVGNRDMNHPWNIIGYVRRNKCVANDQWTEWPNKKAHHARRSPWLIEENSNIWSSCCY